ncbi:MAG: PAS domain-containing protein [Deltaproteobacteria bacterium]|nr:PAS domain-containing protein [Myxococcales bacterium]MDP3216278.1 PAS domain-containing protein [Deltaproteobacteria bacterium]
MSPQDASSQSISEELNEEFLSAIIDHVAHPIFVKDRDFRFVLLNRAMEGMIGIPRAELLGHTDYDFFPKEQADWFRQKDQEMFTLGKRVEVTEEPLTDKDGRHHVLSTTKVPLRDARGVITHLVGIIHDITPLKRAEEALREVSNVLERRMQERTDELLAAQTELVRRERLAVIGLFAGSLAHQIRNPLGSIKNAAYLVQLASPTVDDDLRRALNIIQDEVGRANQIITDLVDYARVTPAQRRVVPVDLLMEIALTGMDLPSNVTVVTECPALPKVFVDPSQLQRALQKLVKNALQAMSNGGTLTLRAHSEGDAVFFCVSDTGRGIPEDVRHRLFEPLVSGNPGNLGLGLITARALIENQGGALALEKTGHEGTCVMLRLPIASE